MTGVLSLFTVIMSYVIRYLLKQGIATEKLTAMDKTLITIVEELKEQRKELSVNSATLAIVVEELKEQRKELVEQRRDFKIDLAEQRKEFAVRMEKIDEKFTKEMAEQRKEFAARMEKIDESNVKIAATLATINKKVKRNSQNIAAIKVKERNFELVY